MVPPSSFKLHPVDTDTDFLVVTNNTLFLLLTIYLFRPATGFSACLEPLLDLRTPLLIRLRMYVYT